MEIEKKNISYSAVVLDEMSKKKILNLLKDVIPDGWKIINHHMTIRLGELPEDLKPFLGHSTELYVTGIGLSGKALALRVEGFHSDKKNPHITVAINDKEGAKPKDSDSIQNWSDVDNSISLRGRVDEIPFPEKKTKEQINESLSIKDINELPFKNDVINAGGQIYSVGGAVRDGLLGKDSKDLDILIAKVPIDKLMAILSRYSDKEVKEVGKSYGVIKFVPKGSKEEIDIAIPRTERKTSGGHTGFDFFPDHNLPVEKELARRDFTINAIAKSHDGKIVDPFNGIEDLKNKIIRVIGEKSFSDDPLRMLRAVQFASRFGFTIEPETERMIKENSSLIKEISPERILIEFDKMIKKGDVVYGIELLNRLNLFKEIFNFNFLGEYKRFSRVKNMADFIYLCFTEQSEKPSVAFKNKFMGDIETTKQLEALEMLPLIKEVEPDDRIVVSKMLNKSPLISESGLLNNYVRKIISDFENGKYPKTFSGLEIDGNDLMAMGLKGKDIGITLGRVYSAVLRDKLDNDKNDILLFIQTPTENVLKEQQKPGAITKLTFFDFDGTMMDSPLPENGKEKFKDITGHVYPHQGWWGKRESLEPFDVKPHASTVEFYNKSKTNPNNKTILLTNRIPKLSDVVKDKLAKYNLSFDDYSFKSGADSKPQRIEKYLQNFPEVTEIEVHDDQEDQLIPLANWAAQMEKLNPGINIVIYDAKDHIFKK